MERLIFKTISWLIENTNVDRDFIDNLHKVIDLSFQCKELERAIKICKNNIKNNNL